MQRSVNWPPSFALCATGHTGSVTAVAMGEVDGEPVVVSGSEDQTVRLGGIKSDGAPPLGLVGQSTKAGDLLTALAKEIREAGNRGEELKSN
jgi:hypothetical protein